MRRFSFILVSKFNSHHDNEGKFTNSSLSGVSNLYPSNLRVEHATRYDSVIESNITSRGDLGYFKNRSPRVISSPKMLDNDELWHGAEDKLISKLEPDEYKALNTYTGASIYSRLNRDMATGKTTDPELISTATSIFKAIRKSEIPEDITLFRGMKARGILLEGDSAIGKVYSDKVFKSTSASQDNAIQFAFSKEPSVILRMKCRKGQQGAYLDGKISQNPQEQEVLLPHNAKFIIVGHSEIEVTRGKHKSKLKVYDCEML